MNKHLILATAALALVACSESPEPTSAAIATPPPVPAEERVPEAAAQETVAEPIPVDIAAPSGQYRIDPAHSNLYFSVRHLGVSNYLVRFTDFEVTVDLDTEDLSASTVQAVIDASSISTDFKGDYAGTHPDSPFATWNETLAKDANFLNSDEYPTITFNSTGVEATDEGTLLVTGDLELRGETQPVTLEATLVGAEQAHPFTGVGLMGFSAAGSFNRSDFGMTHLSNPPIVGDTVTVRFEGEFLQESDNGADTDAHGHGHDHGDADSDSETDSE